MVSYGKTYLLRVVNAAVNAELFFAVAQHNLTVVGVDGHYTKPVVNDFIFLSPGQTMDILLTTNQSPGHYYMAARQLWSQDPTLRNYDQVNATAILQYEGNYTSPDSPSFPSTLPLYKDLQAFLRFSSLIRSLVSEDHPVNVPLNITTTMYITLSMNELLCRNTTCSSTQGDDVFATSVNNISWVDPSSDILLAYYRFPSPLSLFLFFHETMSNFYEGKCNISFL